MSDYGDYEEPPDPWERRIDGQTRYRLEQRRIHLAVGFGCFVVALAIVAAFGALVVHALS